MKLLGVSDHLERYQAQLSAIEYMHEVGANVLWRYHSDVLSKVSSQRVLETMPIDIIKVYLRLRLRRLQI